MKKKENNTDCIFVRNNLFSYEEKKLSVRDTKEFEDHLHSCEECSRIVSDFRSVITVIDEKKSVESNPFFRTRLLQAIESQIERTREKPSTYFQRILRPVSVSFLLLIAIITGFSIVKQMDRRFSENIIHQKDIQAMKSGLNIPDFIDEENTVIDNH